MKFGKFLEPCEMLATIIFQCAKKVNFIATHLGKAVASMY